MKFKPRAVTMELEGAGLDFLLLCDLRQFYGEYEWCQTKPMVNSFGDTCSILDPDLEFVSLPIAVKVMYGLMENVYRRNQNAMAVLMGGMFPPKKGRENLHLNLWSVNFHRVPSQAELDEKINKHIRVLQDLYMFQVPDYDAD